MATTPESYLDRPTHGREFARVLTGALKVALGAPFFRGNVTSWNGQTSCTPLEFYQHLKGRTSFGREAIEIYRRILNKPEERTPAYIFLWITQQPHPPLRHP